MSKNQQFSRPVDAYKAIIDELVTKTSQGVRERLVLEEGVCSKAPKEEAANSFVRSLSIEHRRVLAQMLHDERQSAIFDVLAELTWWISTRDVGLTFRGEPMPTELSGEGLHGDYIGRLADWPWPDTDESSSQ
jgi:hypothetical protein